MDHLHIRKGYRVFVLWPEEIKGTKIFWYYLGRFLYKIGYLIDDEAMN